MKRNTFIFLNLFILSSITMGWGCTSNTTDTGATNYTDGDADADSDSDGDLDSEEVPGETAANGYVTFGSDWYGYAWPEVGRSGVDTISPETYDGLLAGSPLCAAGQVAADGIGSYGMIGINIHEDSAEGSIPEAISLAGDGVTIDLSIAAGVNVLQMELHGARENPEDEHPTWCHKIIGYGGTYRWSEFTTRCFNNLDPGEAYNGEPIQFISITAPGNLSSISFDFCINSITLEADIPEDVVEEYPVKEGEICGDTAIAHVYTQDPQVAYLLSNNVWNPTGGSQCLSYLNNSFTVSTQTNSTSGSAPASYPSLVYGTKTQSENSKYTLLPKRVSDLGDVTTHWSNNAGSSSGTYNASFDVWFNSTENAINEVNDQGNLPTGTYLMVWYYRQGSITPIPSDTYEDVTVANQSWRIWTGSPGPSGAKHIAFVANSTVTSLTFDLKDFIDIAVSKGVLDQNHYLAAIQAGFEIWSGGQGLQTSAFWVDEDTI